MGNCNPKASNRTRSRADSFYSKYTIVKRIGTGTYSTVYAAIDNETNTRYAVKEMKKWRMSIDELKNISREAAILESLDHPNIVKLIECYEDNDRYFIVMELLEGGELFDRMVRKKAYTEKAARDLVLILLSAIKYCHDRDIVHRDLKLENLLLINPNNDTEIKIIDFGFANYSRGSTLRTCCGSPNYMAPEVIKKEPYGKSADMWSAGVIFFFLLGGYLPFISSSSTLLYRKICAGQFKFHSKFWKLISDEAKDLIVRLLTVDVSKRLTVDEALQHPWLNLSPHDLSQTNLNVNLKNFRNHQIRRKWRKAIAAVLAINRFNLKFPSLRKRAVTDESKETNQTLEDPESQIQHADDIANVSLISDSIFGKIKSNEANEIGQVAVNTSSVVSEESFPANSIKVNSMLPSSRSSTNLTVDLTSMQKSSNSPLSLWSVVEDESSECPNLLSSCDSKVKSVEPELMRNDLNRASLYCRKSLESTIPVMTMDFSGKTGSTTNRTHETIYDSVQINSTKIDEVEPVSDKSELYLDENFGISWSRSWSDYYKESDDQRRLICRNIVSNFSHSSKKSTPVGSVNNSSKCATLNFNTLLQKRRNMPVSPIMMQDSDSFDNPLLQSNHQTVH